ncbi:MAG: hypothetical protein ACOY0T_17140 [Myxococcota bacterium]
MSLSVTNRAGLVQAPFFTKAFPHASGFAAVVTAGAAVQLSSIGWLRLNLPISVVRLDFPAGAQVAETALGNLELGLEHQLQLAPPTHVALLGGLLVPTAEYGSNTALLNNRALALGNALNGGLDSPLLTPGITTLRVGVAVEHSHQPFVMRASLALPLLIRISDASLPETSETHAIGVLPTVRASAAVWIVPWFATSLGAALMTEPLRVQEPALERDRNRRIQPVVQPALHFRLGRHVALGLDGSVPVGGTLGGEAWGIGIRTRVGF